MTLPILTEYRQSTLRALEVCARRTRFDLEAGDINSGWTEGSADLGTLFHEYAAEYLRTLMRPECQGWRQMPHEEAINVLREVYAASPITLGSKDRVALRGMALGFCEYKWDVRRILYLEEPLRVELPCPDGEVRTIKGQPDLVYSDPPYGVIIFDWKTGQGRPKAPKKAPEEGATVEGKQYLSDAGLYQREVYGLLVLRHLPAARYAIMRELPMRFPGEGPREARLNRSELEHVEWELGAHMLKLARGLEEGPQSDVWKPRSGSHCYKCEVGRSCPIPPRMRGAGAVQSQLDADILARRFVRGGAMRDQAAEQLKVHTENGGAPGRVNDAQEVRWGPEPDAWQQKGGGRKFGPWPRVDVVETEDAA
jgi:hypothetical protein